MQRVDRKMHIGIFTTLQYLMREREIIGEIQNIAELVENEGRKNAILHRQQVNLGIGT